MMLKLRLSPPDLRFNLVFAGFACLLLGGAGCGMEVNGDITSDTTRAGFSAIPDHPETGANDPKDAASPAESDEPQDGKPENAAQADATAESSMSGGAPATPDLLDLPDSVLSDVLDQLESDPSTAPESEIPPVPDAAPDNSDDSSGVSETDDPVSVETTPTTPPSDSGDDLSSSDEGGSNEEVDITPEDAPSGESDSPPEDSGDSRTCEDHFKIPKIRRKDQKPRERHRVFPRSCERAESDSGRSPHSEA